MSSLNRAGGTHNANHANQAAQTNAMVLMLDAEIDLPQAHLLQSTIYTCFQHNARGVVLDFSQVDFISSDAIAVLWFLLRQNRQADQKLLLCCLSPFVVAKLQRIGLEATFPIFPDQKTALATFLAA